MKKFKTTFLFFFLTCSLFAQKFQIAKVNYDIQKSAISFSGKTQVYALEQNVQADKKTVFESQEDLDNYIEKYKQQLYNTRCFEEVQVTYEASQIDGEENSINQITLNVFIKDSNHFLGMPHVISYNSNQGWKPKLKIKDMNFLGTLNPLSSDIYVVLPLASDSTKKEVGSTFTYDYPFRLGLFNAKWVNNYTVSYSSEDTTPEWNLKTGIVLSYPVKNNSIDFAFYQSCVRDLDYKTYGDDIYYTENAVLSFPITLLQTENFGKITYKPYFDTSINWDYDGINPKNSSLSSPVLTLGHSLSSSKINWINNFRSGLSFTMINKISYNVQRNLMYPYISGEFSTHNSLQLWNYPLLNEIGISSRILAFSYFVDKNNPYYSSDGSAIGERLRGIRDEQYYKDTGIKACTTTSAIVLNLDLPFRFYQTSFTNKLFNYFNMDIQFQPFVDVALIQNKITGTLFNPKDGFYAAGLEGLVYPRKWSSFIIRGSLGFDIGRLLLKDYLNMDWRTDASVFEISFGIGLQY